MIHAKADLYAATEDWDTPTYIAAKSEHTQCLEMLICAKANVDRATEDDCTPLSIGGANEQVQIVKTLIQANANVNIKTKWGSASSKSMKISQSSKIPDKSDKIIQLLSTGGATE